MHPLLARMTASQGVDPAEHPTSRPNPDRTRRLLLGGGLAAMATGVSMVPSRAVAATPTTAWVMGGNTGVNTDGTNYLGTRNVAPIVFKTAATNNVPTERMRITPAGRVGIGLKGPLALLDVNYPTGTAIRAQANGASADNIALSASVSKGRAVSARATSTGYGVHATANTGVAVFGETSAASTYTQAGVVGRSTGSGGIGVIGEALTGNTFGVYGVTNAGSGVYGQATTGIAVVGANVYGGTAMKAQGNAVQSAYHGGWVKAMVRMQGDGSFISGYNGVTGASGSAASCGFSIANQGGGVYNITFNSGIDTQYRYFSLSGSSSIYLFGYPAATTVQVGVGVASYGYAYYILVF